MENNHLLRSRVDGGGYEMVNMENNPEKPDRAADSESGTDRLGEGSLVRQLKSRHIVMIRYANLFPPTLVNNYAFLCQSWRCHWHR